MKKLAMLLCVAAIATGAISCESKAKKEAEEAAKQEMLIKEEAAKQEMLIKEEAAKQKAAEESRKESWRKEILEASYQKGVEIGMITGAMTYPEKEKDLKTSIMFFSNNLKNSDFGKQFPSDVPECIENFKKGFFDGFEEGRRSKL